MKTSLSFAALLAGILAVIPVQAFQQGDPLHERSLRGFLPSGTYHISDIETISTSSGNLSLKIPIANLPEGHGGLSAGMSLLYNSKMWDAEGVVLACGDRGAPSVKTVLISEQFGWSYGYRYDIRITDARDAFGGSCVPACPDKMASHPWKYELVMPDGSVHVLAVKDPDTGPLVEEQNGYWNRSISGRITNCGTDTAGQPFLSDQPNSEGLVLYTTDGTYTRVTAAVNQLGITYTIHFADGRKVVTIDGKQTIYDRNGNAIRLDGSFNPANATNHYAMADDLGHTIRYIATSTGQDSIEARGFNNQPLTWTVYWKTIQSTRNYLPYGNRQSFPPGQTPNAEPIPEIRVVSKVEVPAALASGSTGILSYIMNYGEGTTPIGGSSVYGTNETGELRSITTPAGAKAAYEYSYDSWSSQNPPRYDELMKNTVRKKTFTHPDLMAAAGESEAKEVWQYLIGVDSASLFSPDGKVTSEEFNAGLLIRRTMPSGQKVETRWRENPPNASAQDYVPIIAAGAIYSVKNPFAAEEYTTVANTGGVPVNTSFLTRAVDRNGNVLQETQYDFLNGVVGYNSGVPQLPSIGTVLSSRTNEYYGITTPVPIPSGADICAFGIYACPGAAATLNSVKRSTLSGSQVVSATEYCYDFPSANANLLHQASWDNSEGGVSTGLINCSSGRSGASAAAAVKSFEYDAKGNVSAQIDERGFRKEFIRSNISPCSPSPQFNSDNPSLYVPWPSSARVQLAGQTWFTTTFTNDCATGLETSQTDANQISTSTGYDVFGRVTAVQRASGNLSLAYADDARYIVARQDQGALGAGELIWVRRFDTAGRLRRIQQVESASGFVSSNESAGIVTEVRYANRKDGDFEFRSNPFRVGSSDGTEGWTRTSRDGDGRVSSVAWFGGTALPQATEGDSPSMGKQSFVYDGPKVRTMDAAGNISEQTKDGAGRLASVREAVGISNLETVTEYGYDPFGNVASVCQHKTISGCGQTRGFSYDSMGRLKTAVNPESGQVDYRYDRGGNLWTRTDSRNVMTTEYDGLGRVTKRSYTGADSTPAVVFCYDGNVTVSGGTCGAGVAVNYAKGRLTAVSTSQSTTQYLGFDLGGRVVKSKQITLGVDYGQFEYAHDFAGGIKWMKYPTGRELSFGFDGAGRLNLVAKGASLPTVPNYQNAYLWGVGYAAHGGWMNWRLGTSGDRHVSVAYNSRLQGRVYQVGSSASAGDVWQIENGYGGTDNNGNLKWQRQAVPGSGQIVETRFGYDAMNRLTVVAERAPVSSAQTYSAPMCPESGLVWCLGYGMDRYGNRAISQRSGPGTGSGAWEVANYSSSTNKISDAGWEYDSRGSIVKNPSWERFAFDAEGKQNRFCVAGSTQCLDTTTGKTQYVYDGEGKRVAVIGATGTTVYVYEAGGKLAAEYGQTSGAAETQFVVGDHLGTTRLVLDGAGAVKERVDYQPYGEEIPAVVGTWRANVVGYGGGSGIKQRFTGKERDGETGLDYFGARYVSASQGRFTSADPYVFQFATASNTNDEERQKQLQERYFANPQSWNKYAYGLNNPLKFIDPNGKCSKPSTQREGETGICIEAFIAQDWFGALPVGRGDQRTFSGTDASLTARSRIKITVDKSGKITSQEVESARSGIVIQGFGLRGDTKGTATSKPQGNGSFSVHIDLWGKNGEAFLAPVAPSGVLQGHFNFNISASGKVDFVNAGSSVTGFPSWGIYAYPASGGVQTVKEIPENKIEDLQKPPRPIK